MTKEKAQLMERLAASRVRDRGYEVRDQIQKDIRTFINGLDHSTSLGECGEELCQIVENNFEQMSCNNIN